MPRPAVELAPAELKAHVAANLAACKAPRHLHVRPAPLPRTPAGKVLKPALWREYSA